MRRLRRCAFLVCAGFFCLGSLTGQPSRSKGKVLLAELAGKSSEAIRVSESVAAYLERAAQKAREISAEYVIIVLSAEKGHADSSVRAAEAIMSGPVPTAVLVTERALDGGALMALAADKLFMRKSAELGGTGEMNLPGALGKAWTEEFARVALKKGRGTTLARAMADPAVVVNKVTVDGKELFLDAAEFAAEQDKHARGETKTFKIHAPVVSPRGKRLKMNGFDAVNRFHLADGLAFSVKDVLTNLKREDAQIIPFRHSPLEQLARFVTHPVARTILAIIGLLGLFIEIKIPGAVIPGVLAITCFVLLFLGHQIVGQCRP